MYQTLQGLSGVVRARKSGCRAGPLQIPADTNARQPQTLGAYNERSTGIPSVRNG